MIKFKVDIYDLKTLEYKAFNPISEEISYAGKMNVTSSLSVMVEEKKVAISIKVEVFLKNLKNKGQNFFPIGMIETVSFFSVQDEWHNLRVISKGKQFKIKEELDNFLTSISYNNTRGILKEKGKEDLIGKMILPLLDPAEIKRGNKAEERI